MGDVHTLVSINMTSEQALTSALEWSPREVLIIGTDGEGKLLIRSSKMTRKDSLWFLEAAKIEVMRELYNGDDEI